MNYTNSELFNYFTSILGLLVAMIVLTFAKRGNPVKFSLSLLLTISSLIVFLGALNYSGKVLTMPFLIRIDSPLHYLFGPAAYFYVLSTFKPGFRFRTLHLVHLLPFLLNILFFLPIYKLGVTEKVMYYQSWVSGGSYIIPYQYLLKVLSATFYLCLQAYVFIMYFPRELTGLGSGRYVIYWYYLFLSIQFIMIVGMVEDNLSGLNLFGDPFRYAVNMVSFFLLSVSVALLFFPHILYGKQIWERGIKKKYILSRLTDQDKVIIMDKLTSFMRSGEEPFRDPELSLGKLSESLDISPNRISQVINEMDGMNFNDYLNKFRIDYVIKIMSSPEFEKYTIEAIAIKAGFNSKSPFYKAFRKNTGLTPRDYILNSKEIEDRWKQG